MNEHGSETPLHPYAEVSDDMVISSLAHHMVYTATVNPSWHTIGFETLVSMRYELAEYGSRKRVQAWFDEAGALASTREFSEDLYENFIRPAEERLAEAHHEFIQKLIADEGYDFVADLVYHPLSCDGTCLEPLI
jgi:hypothetical protein